MRADVVVVGAGALGLSTALHLALLGRSVVVVERAEAGSQASGRAAGLFKSIQADELRTRLARRSIARALTFADWAGVPLAVQPSGSVAVARTDAHGSMLRHEVDQSRRWGVPVLDLAPGEIPGRTSLYWACGSEHAWWCPEDVYVEEPMSLVEAYVAACRLHGVEIRERAQVIGVELNAGSVAAVHTTTGRIASAALVDAAGAWTRLVGELAGAWVPVHPVRHQLVITEPSAEVDPSGPIVRVVDVAVYARPARGGVMFGGFEHDPLPVGTTTESSTDDVPLDLQVLRRMAATVETEIPAMRGPALAVHRGGMFTMVPDGRFVAGPVPDLTGMWVASGCNGSGFSSSLALGEALAAQIVGATPVVDVTPLSPGRFPRLDDDELVKAAVWQYAHYNDPAGAPQPDS